MEHVTLRLKTNTKHIDIKKMAIFEWNVEKEEKYDELTTFVTFSRDNTVPYYQKLKELEREYNKLGNYKIVPHGVLIALAIVAFILLTLFVLFGIVNIGNMEMITAMLCFLFPGLLVSGILCLLGVFVTKKSVSYVSEEANRDKIYLEKVKELKDERRE